MSRKKHSRSQGASRGHAARKAKPCRAAPKNKGTTAPKTQRPRRRSRDYDDYELDTPTLEYMQHLFGQQGFAVTDRQLGRFWQYYCLLRQRNAKLDLTRIMGIEATVLKHFIDCALVADMTSLTGPLLDIGSGGGFPGVPIAIRRPDLPVILAESRGKRVTFLRELLAALELDQVRIHDKSVRTDSPFVAQGTDAPPAGALPVHSVITRALETIPQTLTRVQDFVPSGGRVLFMKGPNCGQEVTQGQQDLKGIYKMTEDLRYTLPKTNQKRRLVVFEKR